MHLETLTSFRFVLAFCDRFIASANLKWELVINYNSWAITHKVWAILYDLKFWMQNKWVKWLALRWASSELNLSALVCSKSSETGRSNRKFNCMKLYKTGVPNLDLNLAIIPGLRQGWDKDKICLKLQTQCHGLHFKIVIHFCIVI